MSSLSSFRFGSACDCLTCLKCGFFSSNSLLTPKRPMVELSFLYLLCYNFKCAFGRPQSRLSQQGPSQLLTVSLEDIASSITQRPVAANPKSTEHCRPAQIRTQSTVLLLQLRLPLVLPISSIDKNLPLSTATSTANVIAFASCY